MRATSELYKQIIASGETRNYHVLINITLADDTYITIRDSDIIENSFKILTASSGQNSLDIGSAIIGKCQFTLKNFDDEWTDYDFFDAEAVVWVGLEGDETNGTQNYLRVGFFTVDEPQYSGSMVSLELLDNMWKFDKDLPSIPLPQTIGQIVNRLCTHCGVTLSSNTFNGATYQITELPDTQMNCRELLQYVAMIGCNFCVMNDQGALVVKWYDTASRPSDNLDGGTFSTQTTPYSDGDSADGGNFTNYNTGDDIDGGTFTDNSSVAYFTRLFSRNIGTDIITVTGVKIRINDTDYLRGKEGYVLVLENPLVTESNVSTVLNMIWNRLKDFNFRTFNVTALPDIAPEVGDCVGVSYKGNMVYSYLTNYTFTPTLSTASLGAVTPTRTLSQRYSKAVQAAVEVARERVTQEIGAYDLAAQRMNQLAINAMGGYTDFEDSPTGGRIYYLSNAPITKNEQGMCEFSETAVVYKTTGDGFFISTGVDPETHVRTWTQGYTPSTGLLVEMLTALRINAEQMYTGKLEVGGSQIGVAKPYIRVLDASDNVVCTIDHRGIIMGSGYIASSDFEDKDPVDVFSLHGMKIDVNGKYIKSPHFGFNESGAYLDGEVIANSGQIGAATITQDAIKIIGDVDLYNGSSSFTFKPADYYFLENFKLLFKTSSGTSTVTLVRHQNGTDTTVGTYTADTEGVESAYIDRTLGGDNYYRITVTASTEIIAHDVVIAYMGMEGFRGVLQGIFKGYLESNSGIINGLKYSGSGDFFGEDLRLINDTNEIHLEGGTSSTEPTITRTYNDGNSEVTEEVAWGNKQNYIGHEILPPSSNGREGDLMIAPASQGNAESFYRYENGAWAEIDLGDGGGGGGGGFVGDAGACRTLLYSASSPTFVSDIQLSDDMRNYQYLEIYTRQNNNSYSAYMSYIIDVDYFINNFPHVNSPTAYTRHFLLSMYQNLYTRIICGSDYTKILAYNGTSETIMAVYGVSFGHIYNSRESIYGNFNGQTLYERTILFFDQGSPASGWTNTSGLTWEYSGITTGDISTLWSSDVINCDQQGNYSFNASPYVAWDDSSGKFVLNFSTSYYTWLHIVYMK